MSDLFAYISFFFSIVLLGVTPLPVLPMVLAVYLRFSYAAIPLVISASVLAAILQYFIGRYFTCWCFFWRGRKIERIIHKLSSFLNEVNIVTLVFIRSAQLVPSKALNFCCGYFNVPFLPFVLSLIPMTIIDQFVYLGGVSASMYVDSFLVKFGLSQYHWFFLFFLYIFFVSLFSLICAFLLKSLARLFRLPVF